MTTTTLSLTPTVLALCRRFGLSDRLFTSLRLTEEDAVQEEEDHRPIHGRDVVVEPVDAEAQLSIGDIVKLRDGRVLRLTSAGTQLMRGELLQWAQDVLGDYARRGELFVVGDGDRFARFSKEEIQGRVLNAIVRYCQRGSSWHKINGADAEGGPSNELSARIEAGKVVVYLNEEPVHEKDCLLLFPAKKKNSLLMPTQVTSIRTRRGSKEEEIQVDVKLRSLGRTSVDKDPRQVHLEGQVVSLDPHRHKIARKCRLVKGKPASSLADGELLWTSDPSVDVCERCERLYTEETRRADSRPSLKTLDLFSGAGGLSIGLALAGRIKTKWAVESDSIKAETFRRSHPHAQVFVAEADAILKCLAREQDLCLPYRGAVDVVVAGPPCQGLSAANWLRQAEDPRNFNFLTVLSFVELLRPKFVVIENVRGVLDRLQWGREPQGPTKMIVLAFMALGYSVGISVADARAYGAPQRRTRVLFWASRGEPLPSLPPPLNVTPPKGVSAVSLHSAKICTYSSEYSDLRGCALLPGTSIANAIDDLPAWDWRDPHHRYFESMRNPVDRLKRYRRHVLRIPSYCHRKGREAVGPLLCKYASKPRHLYQEMMRDLRDDGRTMLSDITHHQTATYAPQVVEAIVNIPLRPGAGFQSLSSPRVDKTFLTSSALRPEALRVRQKAWIKRRGRTWERLNGSKQFSTTMTDVRTSGASLHPGQLRFLSMREFARAQGFPDWVTFAGSPRQVQAQIGNAVPIPLGIAIGKAILKSASSALDAKD